jgi:hypothetical protein
MSLVTEDVSYLMKKSFFWAFSQNILKKYKFFFSAKVISKPDQLLPLYIVDHLSQVCTAG